MGGLLKCCLELFNPSVEPEIRKENSQTGRQKLLSKSKSPIKEIKREELSETKFLYYFEIEEKDKENKIKMLTYELEVIHVKEIDSTMPASRQYIDEGNKLPFIYNTIIQTAGVGKGDRKWYGNIEGNLYTSSCIPTSMVLNEISSKDILVKLTAISIIQILVKYSNEFFLKYPNDIICKDKKKMGGIIAENYKDFWIIGFGINIVDKPDPDEEKIRKGGLPPCCIKDHLPELNEKLKALELSIDVTTQIIYNLKYNNTENKINQMFGKYVLNN